MNEVYTLVIVVCSSALICTLLSNFITDGSTKKIVNLILGAFIICSMILPVKNAIQQFEINIDEYQQKEVYSATDDEAYSREVIKHTRANLENTLNDFLLQNGVKVNDCKIILSVTEENSIIISSISIYISKDYTQYTDLISEITMQNFTVMPSIITE